MYFHLQLDDGLNEYIFASQVCYNKIAPSGDWFVVGTTLRD